MNEDIHSNDVLEIRFKVPLVEPLRASSSLLEQVRADDKRTFESRKKDKDHEQLYSHARLAHDLETIHTEDDVPYMSIAPIDGMLANCLACLEGPKGSPYEGGIFWLHIAYPQSYPRKPPATRFVTPIYHPNIHKDTGEIGIDILSSAWSPIISTQQLLMSIVSILGIPVLDVAIMPDIAYMYVFDQQEYLENARLLTRELADGVRPDTSSLSANSPVLSPCSPVVEPLLSQPI